MKPDAPVERNNYFLQTTDELFVQEPFASEGENPAAEDIRLRYERQTFQRLPKSGAIAFLVRTYLTPLTDLRDEPDSLRELMGAMKALPDDMAEYKARHIWGPTVEAYCAKILKEYDSSEREEKERSDSMMDTMREKTPQSVHVQVQELVADIA